ncbi:unnamed protein product, partial [Cladocopium goreaui]
AAFTDSGPVEEEGQNSFAFPSILSEQAQIEAADNFSVEVAGDNTATDKVSGEITFSEVSGLEGANNSLELVKKEEDQQTLGPASTEAVIEAAHQTEGTTTTNLGEDAIVAAVVKAEVDPKSPEADASDIAASVQPVEPVAKPLQPPKHQQGVAVPKERGTTVIAAKASGSAPSSAAVPEAPKAAKLPSPPSSPPPVVPSNIPPPPQHPPPTPEELAARAPAFAKTQEVEGIDPYELEDAAWQNPSLSSRRVVLVTPNLQSSDIVNLTTRDPDTEEEGPEDPALASQRFQETGRNFIAAASAEPIEADPGIVHPWRKQEGAAAESPKSAACGVAAESRATGHCCKEAKTNKAPPPGVRPGAPPPKARQKGLLPHLWRSGVKSRAELQVHLRIRTLPTLHDRALSFLTLVEEWVKQEGVDSILQRRAARAVPKEHLRPPFGDKQR